MGAPKKKVQPIAEKKKVVELKRPSWKAALRGLALAL